MSHNDDIDMMKLAQYIKNIRHLCDKIEKEVEKAALIGIKNDRDNNT